MKRAFALFGAALSVLLLSLAGCIWDADPPVEDKYTSFPEPEILGASFYLKRGNDDVTGANAGTISKNKDGSYKVRIKRRAPSSDPTAIFFTGSFEFSEYYKIVATFPEDPAIKEKPYRLYACASRAMDANLDADYPTANDLLGQAVFRDNVAIGTFEMTNEGINVLNPDRWQRPYITIFLYLYFNNAGDPDDWYEFTLNRVGGANGVVPKSKVVKAAVYRAGDTDANRFYFPTEVSVNKEEEGEEEEKEEFILARFNHRYDSNTIDPSLPVLATDSLILDLKVPDADVGKEIEFEMRNVGVYQTGESLIGNTIINTATVAAGTGAGQGEQSGVVTEVTTSSGSYYKVKAKVVRYANLFGAQGAGVRLVIKGAEPFTDTRRVTFTLFVPDKYVGEE